MTTDTNKDVPVIQTAIFTSELAKTNKRPRRVRAWLATDKYKFFAVDYDFTKGVIDNHVIVAYELAKRLGYADQNSRAVFGQHTDGLVFLFENDEPNN